LLLSAANQSSHAPLQQASQRWGVEQRNRHPVSTATVAAAAAAALLLPVQQRGCKHFGGAGQRCTTAAACRPGGSQRIKQDPDAQPGAGGVVCGRRQRSRKLGFAAGAGAEIERCDGHMVLCCAEAQQKFLKEVIWIAQALDVAACRDGCLAAAWTGGGQGGRQLL
jgi:hypothetical protein